MYEDIQAQFNEVIKYSQGIDNPKTESLFRRWEAAKSKFIHAFGDQLICEWPEEITFELTQEEKEMRINEFIDMIEVRYGNSDLAKFISQNKDGFFANQVRGNYSKKIPKGMKLVKAFKFFEPDEKILAKIQADASIIIQEDKIKGRLCISVHPLDYLSISENNHNWRSCHALDGEFKAGNLSYMTDSSTVICYLKSDKEEILPNFPATVKWNSKKWRVLLFFSDLKEMMFAGRQYPFSNESGLNFIREKFLPKVGLSDWDEWTSHKIREMDGVKLYSPYIRVNTGLYSMKEIVGNEPGALNYNDLLYSSVYDAQYAFNKKAFFFGEKPPKFKIGRECNCLRCGEEKIEITDSMMCNDCELAYGDSENDIFAVCPCCGSRFFYDDGCWVEGTEETICENCAQEFTDYCGCCGNRYYQDDLFYDENEESWICRYCKEENEEDSYGSWR